MEKSIKLTEKFKFSHGIIECLKSVYKQDLETVLDSMKAPGPKYYFRINTLKESRNEIIRSIRKNGMEASEEPKIEECLYFPVKGPFEVDFPSNKIKVDKFTSESAMIGADVYAPGIIKCSGIRLGNKVKIVDPYDQPVATGIVRMGENEILSLRRGLAVENTSSIYRVPKLRESKHFKEGLIYMQSLPSILTSKILDPNPDDIIIDLTCSPGGKLSHISQLMENNGKIIAVDRNERKISITRDTINRLGCNNIELLIHDSRYFHLDFPKIKADKCIVDPPCSALGITPKLYDFSPKNKILALAKYQKQFLKTASKTVKKGGLIVYSVCTVTLEECEEVVQFAVDNCDLEVTEQKMYIGSRGIPLENIPFKNLQRFHPHKHGAGFFIACFKKD